MHTLHCELACIWFYRHQALSMIATNFALYLTVIIIKQFFRSGIEIPVWGRWSANVEAAYSVS